MKVTPLCYECYAIIMNAKRQHQGSRPTDSLHWVGCSYIRSAALKRNSVTHVSA